MTAPPRAVLYSRDMLALAVELAGWPFDPAAPLQATARSRSCGSTLAMSAHHAGEGGMDRLGLKVEACAVGQAAAAIFAGGAAGHDCAALAAAQSALHLWLAGQGPIPAWPRLALLAPALAYPGRHEAIMLPWRAAVEALSKGKGGG